MNNKKIQLMENQYLDKWLNFLNIKTDNYIYYEYENLKIFFKLGKLVLSDNGIVNQNYDSKTFINIYEIKSGLLIKKYDFVFISDLDSTQIDNNYSINANSRKLTEKLISIILISIISHYPKLLNVINENEKEQDLKNEIKSISITNIEFINKSDKEILDNINIFKWHIKEGKKISRRNDEEDIYQIKESIVFYLRIFNVFIYNDYVKTLLQKEHNSEYFENGWNEECLEIPKDKLYLDESETKKIRNLIDIDKLKKSH